MLDEVRYVDSVPENDGETATREGGDLMACALEARWVHLASSPRGFNQVSVRNSRSKSLSVIKLEIFARFSEVPTDQALNRATVSSRDRIFGNWTGTWIKSQELTHESQR